MKLYKYLIHLFALLHAVVAFFCIRFGMADDLMLTLLTMSMVVLICLHRRTGFIFMAIAVILVNLVGFGVGKGLALIFGMVPCFPDVAARSLSTFFCTELIGWGTEGCIALYFKNNPRKSVPDARSLSIILIAFVVIIVLRMSLVLLTSEIQDMRNFFLEMILDYVFSCIAIVLVAEYAIRAHVKAEKASEEANQALFRYMKFKQQLNPHFLFNSLNVLDCLIQENDSQAASSFTHRLADIYRYMLRTEDLFTVTLSEEMNFAKEYVNLLQVRFPSGFDVVFDVPEELMERSVLPCSVQLLIENAVKHNAVSASNPLVVSVETVQNALGGVTA